MDAYVRTRVDSIRCTYARPPTWPPPFRASLFYQSPAYSLPPSPARSAAQRNALPSIPSPSPPHPRTQPTQKPNPSLARTPRQAWVRLGVPPAAVTGQCSTARRAGGARAPASCRIRANMRYYVRRVPTLCTQLITRARSIPVSRSPEFLFSFEFSSFAFSFASAFGFLKVS